VAQDAFYWRKPALRPVAVDRRLVAFFQTAEHPFRELRHPTRHGLLGYPISLFFFVLLRAENNSKKIRKRKDVFRQYLQPTCCHEHLLSPTIPKCLVYTLATFASVSDSSPTCFCWRWHEAFRDDVDLPRTASSTLSGDTIGVVFASCES
jgi:hypothetical protein